MERISRMLRSGLAMVLALCMIISACPVVAFAAADEINYVSLGDSMTNGYCFTGYNQGNISASVFENNGTGVYGDDAYPNLFAAWLEETTGKTVNHEKRAVSAMRAEDLNYLLGGRSMPTDGWFDQVEYYSGTSGAALMELYQKEVAEADVITMSIGNAAFGAYMVQYFTRMLGVMGGSLDEEEKVDLEAALAVLEPDQKAVVMDAYNQMMAKASAYIPEELGPINVQELIDLMTYVGAGFILNYEGVLDQIVELNPDVDVVLVGLMNTTYGMKVTGEGFDPVAIGDIMDILFDTLNAYIAALPTVKHIAGEWEDADFYYADMPNPEFIVQVFDDLYDQGWPADYYGLSGYTVRSRTVKAYNEALRPMIGSALGFDLPEITAEEADAYVFDTSAADSYQITLQFAEQASRYDGTNAAELDLVKRYIEATDDVYLANAAANAGTVFKADIEKEISIVIYLALEQALAETVDSMEITLDGLLGIAGNIFEALGEMPDSINPANNPGPNEIKNGLVGWFTGSDTARAMCKIFAMFKVGDGMSVHPTPAAHKNIFNEVKAAYKNHTVEDETKENIKFVLGEMADFMEEYGPKAAEQLLKVWNEEGYQAIVDETVNELTETATARYDHYKNNVLPALTTTADELTAQKAQLTEQLSELNVQLAAKKAELEAVIAEQEIGSIHTPDISIDTELGNNEQTEVPENDCEGAGNVADELAAAVADLEHAIAVIEALIADVQADIDDMVALATEIAEAIAELEKTMTDVAAAAMDLKEAFDAIVAVLTNESAQSTTDAFIAAFNTARETAYIAIEALELITETATDDVAAIDASLTALEEGIDRLYNNFDPAHADAALEGVLSVLPEELKFAAGAAALILEELEIDKQAVLDKLEEELIALGQEYDPQIAAAAKAIEDKKIEIENEITAKYAEYEQKAKDEIAAKQAEAQAKLEALNAELQGYVAEMEALAEDAAQEVIDGIQAQIDRVNADIAQVNEDLACAVDHINTELKTIHDQIVAEVNAAYADALAELQKIHDDLVAAYNAAIEELKAAADKAIQDLIDAANKEIEKLGDIADEIKDIINGIFQEIRDEIKAVQDAINEMLKGNLLAGIEALKQALNDLGMSGVAALVDVLTDLIEDLIHQATYSDLTLDDGAVYVALGDDTALANGYVEKVAAQLEQAALDVAGDGVDIWVKNYAKAGNTIAKERENLSDVADAELITIGFGNVNMLNTAIDTALNGKVVSYDWAGLVGADLVPYVQDALADVYAEIDATIPDAEMAAAAKAAVESIAYSAVEYAVELPQLIAEIREVNADALIIIVGQYNPMDDAVLDLMGNTMDLGEYIDYFVDAVAAHGIVYSLISGDAIFAEAPDVDIEEVDTKWSVLDLLKMLQNGFATLYPSENGDIYIANQILKALNLTTLKEEPNPFFKDVFADDYYYEAVKWAVKMGITNGYGSADIFAPDVDCTRGQIVTFLWRAAGQPAPKSAEMPFKDVADGEFYTTAVLWAAENGITNGYGSDDIFAPDVTCTRGQIVTMLNRYLGGEASNDNNPFVDVEEGAYYYDAVLWAAENEITNGYGQADTFAPDVTCTRAQIVTFLYRGLHPDRNPTVNVK